MGIVAAVSGFLAEHNCFITESAHFGDPGTGRFFMRTVFRTDEATPARPEFDVRFGERATRFDMEWTLHDPRQKQRVMILVSRFDHCFNDLLYRYRTGSLPMEITATVSNHSDLAPLSRLHKVPFYHLPVTPETKPAQEHQLLELIERTGTELVVLARYMQILSPDLCAKLQGRAINIHHSFLPGFKGAKPYHQAHARGVKLIGATAHYVTEDLDEGPIIEQSVERVDHTDTPADLVAVGRDIESVVLARAVRYHLNRRVLLNNQKTVVFR